MPQQTPRAKAGGFTLVELLVVIGIIVILAGILVPLIGRAMRQAKQTRTAADLGSIGSALEAFKAEFGDYPRTEAGMYNTGAAILGRYLNGPLGDGVTSTGTPDNTDPPPHQGSADYLPGDVVDQGGTLYVALVANTNVTPPNVNTWAPCNNLHDGLDGPGIQPKVRGKKYGPYISSDKMTMRGIAFVDGNGNPILYFPARPGNGGTVTVPGAYVNRSSGLSPVPNGFSGDTKNAMKYDADDNFEVFRRTGEADNVVLHRIRAMLGDYDGDGTINTAAGEKVITDKPYLLWAAGTDGKFGPEAGTAQDAGVLDVLDVDKCDDVVNFK